MKLAYLELHGGFSNVSEYFGIMCIFLCAFEEAPWLRSTRWVYKILLAIIPSLKQFWFRTPVNCLGGGPSFCQRSNLAPHVRLEHCSGHQCLWATEAPHTTESPEHIWSLRTWKTPNGSAFWDPTHLPKGSRARVVELQCRSREVQSCCGLGP